MQYAKIESGYVTNVAIGQPDSSWVVTDGTVSIGATYNGTVFTPEPSPLPEEIEPTPITLLAFRNRFTMTEKQGIYTAAETVVDIRIFLDDIAAASEIDLTDPQTIAGVQALEAAGLITTVRATEILTP